VPQLIPITDTSDPRLGDFTRLTDHEVRAADAAGAAPHFIAEGEWVLDRLIGSAFPVRAVLITPQRLELIQTTLARLPEATAVFIAPQALMEAIAGFDFHRGVLISGERTPVPRRPIESSRIVIALENVSNPDNVGGIFRSVAGLVGSDHASIIIGPGCCDPLYRKAIRVSMGHVFSVPFSRDPHWPASLRDLAAHGFEVLGLALAPSAVALRSFTPPPRCALVLGSEGFGLSPTALNAVTRTVIIPMIGGVDSLNVGVAAAIALYHLAGGDKR